MPAPKSKTTLDFYRYPTEVQVAWMQLDVNNGWLRQANKEMLKLALFIDSSLAISQAYQLYLADHPGLEGDNPEVYLIGVREAHYYLENALFRMYAFLERTYMFANVYYRLAIEPKEMVSGDALFKKGLLDAQAAWANSDLLRLLRALRGRDTYQFCVKKLRHALTHVEDPLDWSVGYDVAVSDGQMRILQAYSIPPDFRLDKATGYAKRFQQDLLGVVDLAIDLTNAKFRSEFEAITGREFSK